MAEDFGFVPDQPTAKEDFGFIPDAPLSTLRTTNGSLNDSLKAAINIRNQAIPFHGFREAVSSGYQTGTDFGGKNLFGSSLGALIAAAQGVGTAFNPISVGAAEIPKLIQSGAEYLGGSPELAQQTLTGQQEILPNVKPAITGSVTQNFISDLLTQVRKDPVNAALIVEGLKSPATIKSLKGAGEGVKNVAKTVKDLDIKNLPTEVLKTTRTAKDDFLTSVLDIQANDIKRLGNLESGRYTELVPLIQDKFTPNSGAKGASKAIQEIVSDQLDKINPIVSESPTSFIDPLSIRSQFDTALSERNFTSSQIKDLMSHFSERINETTPQNLIGYTKRLGEESNALYQGAKREGLNTDTIQAASDLRDIYSGIIKNMLDAQGLPPENYSVTGRLMDMQGLINKNYLQSFAETKGQKGKLLREKIVPSSGVLPTGPVSTAARTGRGIIGKMIINDSKILDTKINNVFNNNARALSKTDPLLEQRGKQLKNSLTDVILQNR